MQLSMVIAGGGGGADTHYLCQLSGRWPSTKEAYYTGLSSVRSVTGQYNAPGTMGFTEWDAVHTGQAVALSGGTKMLFCVLRQSQM